LRGAEGLALVESGLAFMREQEVADPSRMAAAPVPGDPLDRTQDEGTFK
jgi:hypothetical protein